MKTKESVSTATILERAINAPKYSTLRGKINKKWTRYLKNNKLFDEYMVYLSNYKAIGVEPTSYKELSNLCFNLDKCSFFVWGNKGKKFIKVVWKNEFKKFAKETIKWYNIKDVLLYWLNKGYV